MPDVFGGTKSRSTSLAREAAIFRKETFSVAAHDLLHGHFVKD